jgi:transcription antitermination factor NusG
MHKRLKVTQEYELQSTENGGGRNYKSIHDKLSIKERMKLGSEVLIISGTHEGLEGKIIAVSSSDAKSLQKQQ